jgi:hypothetical protein
MQAILDNCEVDASVPSAGMVGRQGVAAPAAQ